MMQRFFDGIAGRGPIITTVTLTLTGGDLTVDAYSNGEYQRTARIPGWSPGERDRAEGNVPVMRLRRRLRRALIGRGFRL